MNQILEVFARLGRTWRWVVGQFVGMPLLILAGILWTRLPDRYGWQVAVTLFVPVLLAICVLELQAGTMRALADDEGKRVKLIWGAMTILLWIAIGAAFWVFLDWCDDHIWEWAGYLNSKAPAGARSKILTFEHIALWLTWIEWALRWIAMPAKLIVWSVASAQWGLRLPVRRIIRILWNWRWWAFMIPAALLAVALPTHLFSAEPKGTVHAQIWSVGLKLGCTYLLAMGMWLCALAFCAWLFAQQRPAPPLEEEFAFVPVGIGPGSDVRSAAEKIPPPIDDPE